MSYKNLLNPCIVYYVFMVPENSKKSEKNGFFHEIIVFSRKFPVISGFLAFYDLSMRFLFKREVVKDGSIKSRYELFFEWLVLDILLNGVLIYASILILFKPEFSLLHAIGFGLLRFILFDLLKDVVKTINTNW